MVDRLPVADSMSISGDDESEGREAETEAEDNDGGLRIVSRGEWRARPPVMRQAQPVTGPITHVFAFNTFSKPCLKSKHCVDHIRGTQNMQMKREFLYDIRYNFMIGADGEVYEGRGWGVVPGLPQKWGAFKETSLMIGIIGTYLPDNFPYLISAKQDELINFGIALNHILPNCQVMNILNLEPDVFRYRDR